MAVENDIVLIYLENSPLSFARIEAIEPDVKRGWHHVKLMLLQIPVQVVTWILRDAYINGDTFTMGGKEMRLEKIVCPTVPEPVIEDPAQKNETVSAPREKGKVITLADLKKKP